MTDETVPPAGAIKSQRLHSGKVISLDVDTVRFPDGSVGEVEVVRHPGASAVLPFLDDPAVGDPRVLLIRQYRYASSGFLLEVPAGRLEREESPESAARRELREETGRTAGGLKKVFELFTTPGFTDEKIHVFFAWDLEAGSHSRERDEFISEVSMPLADALRLIASGEIADAKTALALLFAAQFPRSALTN